MDTLQLQCVSTILSPNQSEPKRLPTLSDQQRFALECCNDHHVIINCVAGSGKTTFALSVAKQFRTSKILILTYNSKLKTETRDKLSIYQIPNMEVHSFHSFCVKYYDSGCFDDFNLSSLLQESKPIHVTDNEEQSNVRVVPFYFDMIIIDEVQDMRSLLYQLVCKIVADNKRALPRFLIMGDERQMIYRFAGADERYLCAADKVFCFEKTSDDKGDIQPDQTEDVLRSFRRCHFSDSYRITPEMAAFICQCMFADLPVSSSSVISSAKPVSNVKPQYLVCDCFGEEMINLISDLRKQYNDDEILILCCSLKKYNSPARNLENKLKIYFQNNLLVHVSYSEGDIVDADILRNKMLFTTFHQAKGIERKAVVVFNFDGSYFKFYNKNAPTYKCPNELYVAVTRASERLFLIQDCGFDPLPFLNMDRVELLCDVVRTGLKKPKLDKNPQTKYKVTELLNSLSSTVLEECMCFISTKTLRNGEASATIKLTNKITYHKKNDLTTQKKSHTECVSDLNGIIIPIFFQFLTQDNFLSELNYPEKKILEHFEDIVTSEKYSDQLQMVTTLAIHEKVKKTHYINPWFQIEKKNWISKEQMTQCMRRLHSIDISPNDAKYEVHKTNDQLEGEIDCIDHAHKIIYEFKCVSTVTIVHFLQVALYTHLHQYDLTMRGLETEGWQYRLYNVLTDELIQIDGFQRNMNDLVAFIFLAKERKNDVSDEDFFRSCQSVRNLYFF